MKNLKRIFFVSFIGIFFHTGLQAQTEANGRFISHYCQKTDGPLVAIVDIMVRDSI